MQHQNNPIFKKYIEIIDIKHLVSFLMRFIHRHLYSIGFKSMISCPDTCIIVALMHNKILSFFILVAFLLYSIMMMMVTIKY